MNHKGNDHLTKSPAFEESALYRLDVSSEGLNHQIKEAANIDDFLIANKANFLSQDLREHLNTLLVRKDITIPQVIKDSELDRKYTYDIFNGKKNPSRDKLIALAFGLHLSDAETQKLLKLAGHRELYVRDERDAIILYSLQRRKDIHETSDLLYEHGFKMLYNAE